MRDIVVRNLTSMNRLNRDCVVCEHVHEAGFNTQVGRRCTYRVESQTPLATLEDAPAWARNLDPHPTRQVYVTKDLDAENGAERVVYKVLGHFYVVWGREVFCINYRHVLSMDVEPDESLSDTEL